MEEKIQFQDHILVISDQKIQLLDGIVNRFIGHPTDFRFGIQKIEISPMVVGSRYRIDLKDDLDRDLTLELNSYLNIGRKDKLELYERVLDILWERFFKKRLSRYKKALDAGEVLELGRFEISKDLIKKRIKEGKELTMELEKSIVVRNWDQLFIQSTFQPDTYILVDTFKEWNSPFIYSILDYIKGES